MKKNIHMPEEAGEWREGGKGIRRQVKPEEGISLTISDFNSDQALLKMPSTVHHSCFTCTALGFVFQLRSSSDTTIMAAEQSDTSLHK